MLKRTQQEIKARYEARRSADFLGFESNEYLKYLSWENAYPYLSADAKEEDWKKKTEDPLKVMGDYMEFAWDKANNCRGISAVRSIEHMIAWLWLAGKGTLLTKVEKEYKTNYQFYGKPILKTICVAFKWDWDKRDSGQWVNSEDELEWDVEEDEKSGP